MDEVGDATCIMHVVDSTYPHPIDHINSVEKILQDFNTSAPRLLVFNKVDQLSEEERATLREEFPLRFLYLLKDGRYEKLRLKVEEEIDAQSLGYRL